LEEGVAKLARTLKSRHGVNHGTVRDTLRESKG
jgi:hypothetical protein